MSKVFCCSECGYGWQLVGELEEVSSITNIMHPASNYGCITPHCNGRLAETSGIPAGFRIKELPVRAFYRAIHGFGSGEGDPASVEEFARLLKTKKIVDLSTTPVGQPERVILHQLVLEDGTRMHFDSSSRGACCYYIERPGKSCVEAIENELSSSTSKAPVPIPDPHREETGRSDAGTERVPELEPSSRTLIDSASSSSGATPVRPVREDSDIPKHQASSNGAGDD